jgi:hypothetical protein
MSGGGTGLISGGGMSTASGGRGMSAGEGCSSMRSDGATTLPTIGSSLDADVLVPHTGVRSDEIGQEADAGGVLKNLNGYAP